MALNVKRANSKEAGDVKAGFPTDHAGIPLKHKIVDQRNLAFAVIVRTFQHLDIERRLMELVNSSQ